MIVVVVAQSPYFIYRRMLFNNSYRFLIYEYVYRVIICKEFSFPYYLCLINIFFTLRDFSLAVASNDLGNKIFYD